MKQAAKVLMVIMAVCYYCNLYAQTDTLYISTAYTTHVIFQTDLTYADLSNSRTVAARIIEQNKNILAVKARSAFSEPTSISALESGGMMHTFIVVYDRTPDRLIVDCRDGSSRKTTKGRDTGEVKEVQSGSSMPELPDMLNSRQKLHHLGTRDYRISILCEDIISAGDNTYMVFSLSNRSSVSYSISDATFVLESRKTGKRTVAYEKTIFPTGRAGSLSAEGGKTSRAAYSFGKLTLSEDQVLRVYFYEENGQRNLAMTISAKDILMSTKI